MHEKAHFCSANCYCKKFNKSCKNYINKQFFKSKITALETGTITAQVPERNRQRLAQSLSPPQWSIPQLSHQCNNNCKMPTQTCANTMKNWAKAFERNYCNILSHTKSNGNIINNIRCEFTEQRYNYECLLNNTANIVTQKRNPLPQTDLYGYNNSKLPKYHAIYEYQYN